MGSQETRKSPGQGPLLAYDEALATLESHCGRICPAVEEVPLPQAIGRVAAVPVAMDRAEPPVRRSAMDGFAVIAADGDAPREIVGVLYAGTAGLPSLQPGQAMAVMTGGTVPDGADTIVMVEHTRVVGETLHVDGPPEAGRHIRLAGEMGEVGRVLVEAGSRLRAGDLAAAASCGVVDLPVHVRPKAIVVSTGDEVVPYAESPQAHQVRDSNRIASVLQLQGFGAEVVHHAHVRDQSAALQKEIGDALEQADLVVTIGGVSMGDKDLMPGVFAQCGVDRIFHKVSLQPGKPVWAGQKEGRYVLGLPGNPVSAFTVLELFGRLLVDRLGGATTSHPRPFRYARTSAPLRSRARPRWLPARLEPGEADWPTLVPCTQTGSGDWTSLAQAEVLLHLPPQSSIEPGDVVAYLPLT